MFTLAIGGAGFALELRQETGREEQKEVQRGTNRITEDVKLSSRGNRIERNGERNLKRRGDGRRVSEQAGAGGRAMGLEQSEGFLLEHEGGRIRYV